MALIKTIESKVRFVKTVALVAIVCSLVIAIGALIFASSVAYNANKTIYVLADNTPIMAMRTDFEVNRPVEYEAQIDYFHSLFFNLSPDNDFIERQMKKAMYLIDDSGIQQYRNMKEKGFFSSIIASNSVVTLITDSINVDVNTNSFVFYGKQIIDRRTSRLIRTLVTSGELQDIPRSENNSHGVLISNWKTIENKDLTHEEKN
ncbi:MAG: conjugative transposon protein TraK [Prevotella sp.]|jgi:conjugative transposon TraK protein|nr:conjugative transposon protein TraK [Prevotella sp.]